MGKYRIYPRSARCRVMTKGKGCNRIGEDQDHDGLQMGKSSDSGTAERINCL